MGALHHQTAGEEVGLEVELVGRFEHLGPGRLRHRVAAPGEDARRGGDGDAGAAATSAREVRRVERPGIGAQVTEPATPAKPLTRANACPSADQGLRLRPTHRVRRETQRAQAGMAANGKAFPSTMSRKSAEPAPETDFFADAACQGADTTVFFPVSDTYADEAKAICADVPGRRAVPRSSRSRRTSPTVCGAASPRSSGTASCAAVSASPREERDAAAARPP